MENKILALLNENERIVLLTHTSPDGDAIGSVLGIYSYLIEQNKSVDVIIQDVPKVFDFLPYRDIVMDYSDKEYELAIVCDCASKERVGGKDILDNCKTILVIDHHKSNTLYGNFNYVQGNISSCCEAIYYLFKDLGLDVSSEMAKCILTGVITDTNGFSVNTVKKNTFLLVADILGLDVNLYEIYNQVMLVKTKTQFALLNIGMKRLKFFMNGKIAFTYILKRDFEKVGATVGEHEGIVNIGRNVQGVEVSLFLREDVDGVTISLRSSGKIDVSAIANIFGGGGHAMAAGAKVNKRLRVVKNMVIKEIEKAIQEYEWNNCR